MFGWLKCEQATFSQFFLLADGRVSLSDATYAVSFEFPRNVSVFVTALPTVLYRAVV